MLYYNICVNFTLGVRGLNIAVFAKEDAVVFIKFGGAMLGIMMLIFLIALLTPKMAGFIDKLILKNKTPSPERVENADGLQSPFGASSTGEDLNHKIYNEDIYAIKGLSKPSDSDNDIKKDGNENG